MARIKLIFSSKTLVLLGLFTLNSSPPAFAAASQKIEVLHVFDEASKPDGAFKPSWLIQGKDGNLYGSTFGGFGDKPGKLFKIDLAKPIPAYSNFLSLGLDNFLNFNHFIQARNGSFYGVGLGRGAFAGPEYLFKAQPEISPPLYSELMALPTYRSDAIGTSELLQGNGDKFYATMSRGGDVFDIGQGTRSAGMIVQINAASLDPSRQVKVLHKFNFVNGANPSSGLIHGKDGKLYGTTCSSGAVINGVVSPNDYGVIYSFDLTKVTPVYRVLHRFNGTNGGCPQGLFQSADGKLYGTTDNGGSANQGVIFSLDITKFKPVYRVLHNFNNIVDVHARSRLVQSWDGKFYGTTLAGGKLGQGTLFQLDISGHTPRYIVIHEFDGKRSGSRPTLIKAKDGNLYGIAQAGPLGGGLVYRIKLSPKPKW